METSNQVTKLSRESSGRSSTTGDAHSHNKHECKDHTHSDLKERIKHFIGLHHEAPNHNRGNQHIKTGYRVNYDSLGKVVKSLFHKHNESYNIWSHLIGFVLVILSMVVIYYKISPELHTINIYSRGNCSEPISLYDLSKIFRELPARQTIETELEEVKSYITGTLCDKLDSESYDWLDVYKYIDNRNHANEDRHTVHRWPIFVFLFSAAFCLMGSSVYHLTNCMSERIGLALKRIDYAGISILITGSCFPPYVYGFYCQPHYAIFYLTLLSIVSLIAFFASVGGLFTYPKYHKIKGIMYGGLGLFAAVPGIHLVYNELHIVPGSDYLPMLPACPWYLAMGASYLAGLYLYVHRIPEKFVPGKVDNCGNSHNLWHTLILIAIIFHYFGSFENYYTRMEIPCRA